MKNSLFRSFLFLFLSDKEAFAESTPSSPADTIFLNGNVYTVNDAATAGRSDRDQG